MTYTGELRKMPARLQDNGVVEYGLLLYDTASESQQLIPLNDLIGQRFTFNFEGNIYCQRCGRKTNKSFAQGFCYPCFRDAPENSECIIHPEKCRAHLGEGRDPEWEEKHHNQPHYVYLAATDKVKVGVTRDHQVPTRWIDQGASAAIKLAKTPNRYLAGMIEVALKETFDDKTNWRSMLRNDIDESIDLLDTKRELEPLLPADIAEYITDEDEVTHIEYPALAFPTKIKTINLDKNPHFEAQLIGIKGQYLLLDDNRVINIRKYAGYQVTVGLVEAEAE